MVVFKLSCFSFYASLFLKKKTLKSKDWWFRKDDSADGFWGYEFPLSLRYSLNRWPLTLVLNDNSNFPEPWPHIPVTNGTGFYKLLHTNTFGFLCSPAEMKDPVFFQFLTIKIHQTFNFSSNQYHFSSCSWMWSPSVIATTCLWKFQCNSCLL